MNKINFIFLIIILVLSSLVFKNYFNRPAQTPTKVRIILGLTPEKDLSPYWSTSSIKIGSRLIKNKKKLAEVLAIDSIPQGYSTVTILDLAMVLEKNLYDNSYVFDQQPLSIGGEIAIQLDNTVLKGMVVWIEGLGNLPLRQKYRLSGTMVVDDRLVAAEMVRRLVSDPQSKNPDVEVRDVSFDKNLDTLGLYNVNLKATVELYVFDDGQLYYAYLQPVKVGNKLYIPHNSVNLYKFTVKNIEKL